MAKIIITFLLFAVQLQAQSGGTWVSGGGGDTSGIVHNAIRLKGIYLSLIPPVDNQIWKYDAAADSFKLEADVSAASGSDSIFLAVTIHDLDLDTLFFKASGFSGTNTFAAGTRIFAYKDDATELFGIDSTGTVVIGIWSGTPLVDAKVDDDITATNYLLLAAILDTLDNYDGDITFTQGKTTYKNFLDSLNNYNGDITFTQGQTAFGNLLDSLDNYDGDITFTQGQTTYKNFLDSLNNYNGDVTFTQGQTAFGNLLDTLNNYDGDVTFTQGNTTLSGFVLSKSWFIESPVAQDSLVGTVRWPYAVTIDSVITVVEYAGTIASPPVDTVTFNMRHGVSFRLLGPDGTGTLLFSANQTIKDNTTGNVFSSFNDNTITAGSWISPYIVTKGGTVASATILLYWHKDP